MQNSKIAWTDHTFNPWWGCVRVSPGCEHCYAETFSKRVGRENLWGVQGQRRAMSASYWKQPGKWNNAALMAGDRARVFCASMADVFEDREDLIEPRERLFELIKATTYLDWLLLTKRPQNIKRMLPMTWSADSEDGGWMPDNVWLLTTTEDQLRFGQRVPHLVSVPAVIHGLSVEPMLGPVDLYKHQGDIDWVICGGESGPGARPMDLAWARELRDQCRAYHIPFFMKQMGSATMCAMGKTGKGDDVEDLPEDLRIREFPQESSLY